MPLSFYPAIYKLIYSHNQLPAAFSLSWNTVTDKLERGYSLSGTPFQLIWNIIPT